MVKQMREEESFLVLAHFIAVRVVQRAELAVKLNIDCEIQIPLLFLDEHKKDERDMRY